MNDTLLVGMRDSDELLHDGILVEGGRSQLHQHGRPRGGATTDIQRRILPRSEPSPASVSYAATGTGSAVASIASGTVFVCS